MSTEQQNVTPQPGETTGSGLLKPLLKSLAILAAIAVVLLLGWSSMVFVDESEYVIVERFGDIVAVYDRPDDRGLQFKLPWPIDTVRRFDRRVRLYRPPGREVFTADKKNLTVSAYVCWKIAEPPEEDTAPGERPAVRFFRNLASPEVAESRLDSRVRSLLSTELGRIELGELLTINGSDVGPREGEQGLLAKLAANVRNELQSGSEDAPSLTKELGIEIVDLRIRRINFPTGNRQAVYDRMRSERKREAYRYRSEGLAQKKAIESRANLHYQRVLAQANADAERLRGSARAEAIAIRNATQAKDPEFYTAVRTLEAYKKILNEKTTLVLSASSELLKMLTNGIPAPKPQKKKQPLPSAKNTDGKKSPASAEKPKSPTSSTTGSGR